MRCLRRIRQRQQNPQRTLRIVLLQVSIRQQHRRIRLEDALRMPLRKVIQQRISIRPMRPPAPPPAPPDNPHNHPAQSRSHSPAETSPPHPHTGGPACKHAPAQDKPQPPPRPDAPAHNLPRRRKPTPTASVASCCAIGRNCSDALNALVRWIVCAVGFREAVDAACVLLVALLPFVVLLEPPVFAPPLPVFPAEDFARSSPCSYSPASSSAPSQRSNSASPATPPQAHGAVIPITEATATAPRNLPQMLVTVSSLFQPT